MTEKNRRRRGRKSANATSPPKRQPNYRQLKHPFPPQTIFSDDEIHNIHHTALRVLEELGIKVLLPEAREIFGRGDATIKDDMVYIGRDSAANVTDMQGGTENTMGLWGATMANATLTIHAAGWLEGGLTFGYEKFINDLEALQSIAELATKTDGSDAEIGFEALADVQPGGHFFATQHTMDRYASAFYEPLVADLSNFENWQDNGAKTATERATTIWQQTLRNFEVPATGGEQITERLQPYIERKIQRGGAAPVD